MCMCVYLITSSSPTQHTHTCSLAHAQPMQLPWATEAGALGCGMPRLRWRGRMMAADSSQCDPPPHPRSPSLSDSSSQPLPLSLLFMFSLSLSLYLYLSFPFFLTLSHACWLWANNSTSTCLDRFTFLKMTMSVASYPALDVFFIWVPHCDDVVLWMFYRGVFLNPDRQTLSFFLIFFKGKENEVQESANQLLNNICFLGQK